MRGEAAEGGVLGARWKRLVKGREQLRQIPLRGDSVRMRPCDEDWSPLDLKPRMSWVANGGGRGDA